MNVDYQSCIYTGNLMFLHIFHTKMFQIIKQISILD